MKVRRGSFASRGIGSARASGRFARFVESVDDCEDFGVTIADDFLGSRYRSEWAKLTMQQSQSRTLCPLWVTETCQWIPSPKCCRSRHFSDQGTCWSMDEIHLVPSSKKRPCIMKSPPSFRKGRTDPRCWTLTEVEAGHRVRDEARSARVWKLFLLPRILLHKLAFVLVRALRGSWGKWSHVCFTQGWVGGQVCVVGLFDLSLGFFLFLLLKTKHT